MKIQVIIGSTRPNRFSEKPAKWIFEKLSKMEGVEAELIDLRNWPLPFFNEPMSPNASKGKYTLDLAAKWAEKIGEGDAYIMVTPEYNHGYSAVLKNAIDYVFAQWHNKPVAFISYGGIAAGTRAVQQLRQVVIELQMVPIRNGVHFPFSWTMVDENGNLKPGAFESAEDTAKNMLEQLIWFAKMLKTAREETTMSS